MKVLQLAVALAGGLGLATLAYAAPQHDHASHASHAADAGAAAPIPAQRWATDAPLREGMARVNGVLDELRHYEMGHMGEEMALDRVATIEDAIAFMFANCKLEPQADAALHDILLPLLAAAQRLKANPQDLDAVAAMRAAVANYPRYFDDPQATVPAAEPAPAPADHDAHDAHDAP